MKKKLLCLLAICSMSMAAWAQEMTYVLVISQKDGTTTTFTLDQNPVIKFVGDDIQIYTDESYKGGEVTYFSCHLDELNISHYAENDVTAIEDAKADKAGVKVTYTDGQNVVVSGLAETDRLSLYALDGRKVEDFASEGGQANISLAKLSAGVYVVNINSKQSFKIMKR